jgi:uncharacterized membrane protein SpoIIM required for sporulation
MVLDILINPKKANGKPWEMFFVGIVYSLVGMLLGYWIFKSHVSIIMVTLSTIAAIPFIHTVIVNEEKRECKETERQLLKDHSKVIEIFTFLFLGNVFTFLIAYLILPVESLSLIFNTQLETISIINNNITGNFIGYINPFLIIFGNNLKILLFCLIFSLFYGAGAIFIITWNASVMAVAIGVAIRAAISNSYYHLVPLSVIGYFIHGIPEIVAYFIAGLAGGILSFGLINEKIKSKTFNHIIKDFGYLMVISIIVLFVAALIEIFVSPLFL